MTRRETCALLAALLLSAAAAGVELWSSEGGERSLSLDTALKWTSLLLHAPDDPDFYSPDDPPSFERWGAMSLWRLRLGLEAELAPWIAAGIAYEHRSSGLSEGGAWAAGAGFSPSGAEAPYRVSQLDWSLVEVGDTFFLDHEIDRAFVALHPEWGEVTLGRQAVGWGRGVLFGAVDIFSPFAPTEADREWRRGIDAVRADIRLSDTSSLDVVAAFGEEWDESAVVGRLRGYAGNADGELIFGKRAEDWMYAATCSAAVGDAELHCELAVFDVPEEPPDGGLFGSKRLVGKAVLGGSYNFDVGSGLIVFCEYHYSGFGLKDLSQATDLLKNDPAFLERYLRGDSQILGRHAFALQASCTFRDTWTAGITWLQGLTDGSGLVAPSVTWDFAQNITLVGSAYLPYGAAPEGGEQRSEYGAAPVGGFLQVRLYY